MAIFKRRAKDGTMRYQVRVQDETGHWYPAKTFHRQVDAQRYERGLKTQRDAGALATTTCERAVTVDEYFDKWRAERRAKVSEGWRISQDQMWTDYIKPVIGSLPLRRVRSEHVARVLQRMQEMPRSPQTQRHVFQLMHGAFGAAVRYYRLLDTNPVTAEDRPELLPTERTVLTPDQTRRLLAYTRDMPIGPAVWLGTLAAMRPSEVQALRFGALDFDRNEIHIVAAFKRKTGKLESYPKERRHNVKPMMPPLKELLMGLASGRSSDEFVASSKPPEMLSYNVWYSQLGRLCGQTGFPRIAPHGLRHCATELWVEAGATEEDVIRLLNHVNGGSIRRYMHPSLERLHRLAGEIRLLPPTPVAGGGQRPQL